MTNEIEGTGTEIVIRPLKEELSVKKDSCLRKLKENLDEGQKATIDKWISTSVTRFATENAMICKGKGSDCTARCIFTNDKSWPVGQPCPMESIQKAERVYELCLELNYDNMKLRSSDFRTILCIVDLEILQDATLCRMKDYGLVIEDIKIVINMTQRERKANPLYDKLFKIIQIRKELLESLLGTRQSRLDAYSKVKTVMCDVKDKIKEDYADLPTLEEL